MAQTLSASSMALGHGLQDAQKTMGVIVLALVTGGYQDVFGGGRPSVSRWARFWRTSRRSPSG
jgi:phosphate/sulfate permease